MRPHWFRSALWSALAFWLLAGCATGPADGSGRTAGFGPRHVEGRQLKWSMDLAPGWLGGTPDFWERKLAAAPVGGGPDATASLLRTIRANDIYAAYSAEAMKGNPRPTRFDIAELYVALAPEAAAIGDPGFRARLWQAFQASAAKINPANRMTLVSEQSMKTGGQPAYQAIFRTDSADGTAQYQVVHYVTLLSGEVQLFQLRTRGPDFDARYQDFSAMLATVRYERAPSEAPAYVGQRTRFSKWKMGMLGGWYGGGQEYWAQRFQDLSSAATADRAQIAQMLDRGGIALIRPDKNEKPWRPVATILINHGLFPRDTFDLVQSADGVEFLRKHLEGEYGGAAKTIGAKETAVAGKRGFEASFLLTSPSGYVMIVHQQWVLSASRLPGDDQNVEIGIFQLQTASYEGAVRDFDRMMQSLEYE
ncbi:hypothetical protein [Nitrospira sp. Kam-Ns4a]